MKLSDWASVAEIFSGFAVVITLIFLIVGIRSNTEMTRLAVYSELVDDINSISSDVYRDADLSVIWAAFNDGETAGMDARNQARLIQVFNSWMRNAEKAYYGKKSGVLGEREWERLASAICYQYGQAVAFSRANDRPRILEFRFLTEEFASFVENSCDE